MPLFRRTRQAAVARHRWEYDLMQWPAMLREWPMLSQLEMFATYDRADGTTWITRDWSPEEFFREHVPQRPGTRGSAMRYHFWVVRQNGLFILSGQGGRKVQFAEVQRFLMQQYAAHHQIPRDWHVLRLSMAQWGYFHFDILSNEEGTIDEWLQRRMAV